MINDFDEELINKMNEMKANLLKNKEVFIEKEKVKKEQSSKFFSAIKTVSQKTKACPYCGMLLDESENKCSNCGKKI